MNINLVDSTQEDYDFAKNAHHLTYRDMVVRQFGSWDISLQDDFFDKTWNRYKHSIIVVDNESSGYCCIEEDGMILWIRELVICPEKQNKGIGSELLNRFVNEGEEKGFSVQLNVMKTNDGAKRLYERLGFGIYGQNNTHFLMRYGYLQPVAGTDSAR